MWVCWQQLSQVIANWFLATARPQTEHLLVVFPAVGPGFGIYVTTWAEKLQIKTGVTVVIIVYPATSKSYTLDKVDSIGRAAW